MTCAIIFNSKVIHDFQKKKKHLNFCISKDNNSLLRIIHLIYGAGNNTVFEGQIKNVETDFVRSFFCFKNKKKGSLEKTKRGQSDMIETLFSDFMRKKTNVTNIFNFL